MRNLETEISDTDYIETTDAEIVSGEKATDPQEVLDAD